MIALLLLGLVSMASATSRFSSDSSSCSAPPASLEICLSQVFLEIEGGLSVIAATLQKNEGNIKNEMHHEHTLLHSEVSWVSLVESIASSVQSAVNIDYEAIVIEVNNLKIEISALIEAYAEQIEYFNYINGEIGVVIEEKNEIVIEYNKIAQYKWSLYEAISAIVYEKLVIQQEQAQVEAVVAKLHAEMQLIYEKVVQLNKRQSWLLSWEEKLSFDLHELYSNIQSFRGLEIDLYDEQVALLIEQQALQVKVEAAESCIESLYFEYEAIFVQLQAIYGYEALLKDVEISISEEVSVFIHAYEEFTCEDSLLYYEACSASHPLALNDALPAADVAAAPVEPTEE